MEKAEKAQLLQRIRALREQVDILTGLIEAIPEPKEPVRFDLRPSEMRVEYLNPRQVQELLGIGESTFYIWLKEGRLPKGQQWGPRSRRWRSDELETYHKKAPQAR